MERGGQGGGTFWSGKKVEEGKRSGDLGVRGPGQSLKQGVLFFVGKKERGTRERVNWKGRGKLPLPLGSWKQDKQQRNPEKTSYGSVIKTP